MTTKKFNTELLLMLINGESVPFLDVIENKFIEQDKHRSLYYMIFKYGNDFYRLEYFEGEDYPFPQAKSLNEYECKLLKPIQKTITVYEPVE